MNTEAENCGFILPISFIIYPWVSYTFYGIKKIRIFWQMNTQHRRYEIDFVKWHSIYKRYKNILLTRFFVHRISIKGFFLPVIYNLQSIIFCNFLSFHGDFSLSFPPMFILYILSGYFFSNDLWNDSIISDQFYVVFIYFIFY